MPYLDVMAAPVPADGKDAYLAHVKEATPIFLKHGALRLVECWGDDVPDGETTSFPMAVKLKEGETVVVSFIEWPDRETRDAGMGAVMQDPAMTAMELPFDGKRLIFGGFDCIMDSKG